MYRYNMIKQQVKTPCQIDYSCSECIVLHSTGWRLQIAHLNQKYQEDSILKSYVKIGILDFWVKGSKLPWSGANPTGW